MSLLKIARLGHPKIRCGAAPVTKDELSERSTQGLIDDMIETMHDAKVVVLPLPKFMCQRK